MEISAESSTSNIEVKNLTQENRKSLCEEWKSSGINASEFCRQKGLCTSTFHGWCKKLGLYITNKKTKSNKKISHKKDDKNWMPLISKSHQSSELEGLKLVEMKFPNQMIIGISLSMDDIQLLLKGLYHATTVIR